MRTEAGGDDGGWMRGLGFQKDEEAVDRRGWVAVVRGEATTAMTVRTFRESPGLQAHHRRLPSFLN